MVFVNDKKFACESCIKGHRSSSCHHTDRPLFEIKKKGRPVSQCDKCRELRKTRRVHNKCECSLEKADKVAVKQLSGKSKRYIPILPTLPNGLKDAVSNRDDAGPSDPRGQVVTLLNPCACKDVWNCNCRPSNEASGSGSSIGLDTLATAAAMCCGAATTSASNDTDPSGPKPINDDPAPPAAQKHPRSCCQRPSSPSSPPSKRRKGRAPSPETGNHHRGPSLAPILTSPTPASAAPPVYPEIPPLHSIASLAGTGCTCGFDCSCPGCVEHRGPEHVSKAHEDCPDCGTCVDHSHGSALPSSAGIGSALPSSSMVADASPSFIDAFFARAAATIPPPPSLRASAAAGAFDPSNITVYPQSLFAGERKRLDEHGPAFGLVRLPKLECCAGRCGCLGDSCGCGKDCNGCCATNEPGETDVPAKETETVLPENLPVSPAPVRSCCAGKTA